MSRARLEEARDLIIAKDYEAARAILNTLPESTTAQQWLEQLADHAPVKRPLPFEAQAAADSGIVTRRAGSAGPRWEYLEVFITNWKEHADNVGYALDTGGQLLTVDDFYTRMLNEYGAEGWELLSESVEPTRVRLLFKRMA